MAEKIVMFDRLVEQERIWRRIVSSYKRNRVASAYLFYGPAGTGKEGYAIKFATLLNCRKGDAEPCGDCPSCKKFYSLQHPNLTLIVPLPKDKDITKNDSVVKALSDKNLKLLTELMGKKGRNPYSKINLPRANRILINSIRDLRKTIFLKMIESGRKVILIFDAHKLSSQQGEAGNALLKILEEPPEDTTFILTTDFPDQLPETIRSRCQSLYFPPLPDQVLTEYFQEVHQKTENEALLISHLSQGNIRTGLNLITKDMNEIFELLESLIDWVSEESESGWRRFLVNGSSLYRSNPQEFAFQLQLMSYWFRDAMFLAKLNGKAQLILADRKEKLAEYITRFPDAKYPEIIDQLETCVDSLSRNYNLNLVLMNLLLDIQNLLHGRLRNYA
ncbi:MAG: DNA polymerase III subunit delta' [Candidatus Marinimicrobia bacterium]|nr:DNA polymerase III subunit delta' [Candidatus Neomarinimicrobiota bacterium]